MAAERRMLHRIGQEVEDDFFEEEAVVPGHDVPVFLRKSEFDLFLCGDMQESPVDFADKLVDVVLAHLQFHLAGFAFAQVHQLIDKQQEALRIVVDQFQFVFDIPVEGFGVQQDFQRGDDQGERCPQFMREVGVHPHLGLMELLLLLLFLLFEDQCLFEVAALDGIMVDHPKDPQHGQGVQDPGIPGAPERRTDGDAQPLRRFVPETVVVGGLDFEDIFSRAEVGEIGFLPVSHIIPFTVLAKQPISILV